MQRAAQALLSERRQVGQMQPKADAYFAFRYRVAMCQRGKIGEAGIELYGSEDGVQGEYRNLQTCGSVWHCPICAPKIAQRRCEEMDLALTRHVSDPARAGAVFFLSFTMQHDRATAGAGYLEEQLATLRGALKAKGNEAWRAVLSRCGSIGSIRALEVTYGELNGWHSHAHELRFAERGAMVLDREHRPVRWLSPMYRLRTLWARELVKRGSAGLRASDTPLDRRAKLRALLDRCLTIQDGSYASSYVAEFGRSPENSWSLSAELALSHLKTARRSGHCDPWGLLADFAEGDARSGELFQEYGRAFHGVTQLYWSRGLKAHFGVEELQDAALAAVADKKCTRFLARVSDEEWSLVLRYNARFELLRAAVIYGPFGAAAYIAELRDAQKSGSPPRFSGVFTASPDHVLRLREAA
jgi:hypothetical protein